MRFALHLAAQNKQPGVTFVVGVGSAAPHSYVVQNDGVDPDTVATDAYRFSIMAGFSVVLSYGPTTGVAVFFATGDRILTDDVSKRSFNRLRPNTGLEPQ